MIKKDGIIISGFGGVGKTELAKRYKNVIDLESSPYKYNYSGISKLNFEQVKGKEGRELNANYPENYIKAIKKAMQKYDIVCVRYNADEPVDFYDTYGLKYIVCYPTKKAYKKYRQRFIARGNSDQWIEKNKRLFEIAFQRCKRFKGEKILLHDNETLESALIKRGYKLIKK